ncbi:MAG: hypothetical protein PHH93_00405 [Prolixibacteraceae bacterium]|nr:hypothetical protein [Prolixibacteraceae bacterium]
MKGELVTNCDRFKSIKHIGRSEGQRSEGQSLKVEGLKVKKKEEDQKVEGILYL